MLLRVGAGAPEWEGPEVRRTGSPPGCECGTCRVGGHSEGGKPVEKDDPVVAERDHAKRVGAERAAGEERKRLTKR